MKNLILISALLLFGLPSFSQTFERSGNCVSNESFHEVTFSTSGDITFHLSVNSGADGFGCFGGNVGLVVVNEFRDGVHFRTHQLVATGSYESKSNSITSSHFSGIRKFEINLVTQGTGSYASASF